MFKCQAHQTEWEHVYLSSSGLHNFEPLRRLACFKHSSLQFAPFSTIRQTSFFFFFLIEEREEIQRGFR